jgi:hypothetical protein
MKKLLNEWKNFLNEQEGEVAVSSFDKRKQQIVRIHDGFVESLEVEGKFPIGEIPKSVMDALMNAAIITADAMGGDLNEGEQISEEQLDPDKYYLMDGGRVYKGPFDSYEEAEDAEDVGGLQIKSPKPKFSPEEIAAAKARAAKFGL